jgi:RND family efflux transporter MFP subunit
VSEGERVRKGQLLAVLNNTTAQNAYEVAKSTLYQAQDAYDRLNPLHEKGSLTDIKWIEVESGLDKAKAMEAIAKKSVEDCNLYAPVSGVIAKRSIEEGVNVMPGLSAFKLVSIDEVYINVPVPENEIGSINTGQPASVTVPAIGNHEYKGVVDKKGVEANPISRTYALKVKVGNPKSELMPGMVCKVSLTGDVETAEIVVPNRTIQIAADGRRYVWLADGDIAKRQFVKTGGLNDSGIVIVEGLTAGDKLIVEGFQKVSEGMRIVTNYELQDTNIIK